MPVASIPVTCCRCGRALMGLAARKVAPITKHYTVREHKREDGSYCDGHHFLHDRRT